MTHVMDKRKPRLVGWEVTSQCNLHCPHCYSPPSHNGDSELTFAESVRLIDSLAERGTEIIGWTGGEPLLNDRLEDLVGYAFNHCGIKSSVTTNGVLLDETRARRLKQAGLYSIQISLDGTDAQGSYRIRRTSNDEFERIIAAIDICQTLGMRLNLAMLLGEENFDEGHRMIEFARSRGIRAIRFCGFTPAGRARNKTISQRFLVRNRAAELKEFIEHSNDDGSPLVMFDPGFGPLPPHYCYHECVAGIETMYIKANGDVFPCTALLFDECRIGNLRNRSLDDIWNSDAMTRMANFPRKNIVGRCRTCDMFERCRGACRGITFAHTGSFDASFPCCLYQIGSKTGRVTDIVAVDKE